MPVDLRAASLRGGAVAVGLAVVAAIGPEVLRAPAADVLGVGSVGALLVGLRVHRPKPAWPWWAFVGTGLLCALGGALRAAYATTGDLTASRSLWPDVCFLPAYALLALALHGLRRARDGRDPAGLLDAGMLAAGTLLLGWVLLAEPIFTGVHTPARVQLAILAYPPMSLLLVALAARLSFTSGRRNVAHHVLLAGTAALLAGDVLGLFVEAGDVHPAGDLANLPYSLAFAALGVASLHPSMVHVATADTRHRGQLTRPRLALVAAALLAPAFVLATWSSQQRAERLAVAGAAGLLAALAVVRVVAAMVHQARSESALAHRATHDALTDLPNRVVLLESLDELLAARTPVALVYCDLDQFKRVNDTLGHAVGDELLGQVARRLRSTCRPGDLVTRLSGDEFAVVALVTDAEEARQRADRLRLAFAAPFELGRQLFVTASVGVAVALGDTGPTSALDLLRDADTAMYDAKAGGRNAVRVADDALRRAVARRVAIEDDLRAALAAGGLEVHYQPVVDLASGRVRGVEALLRWPGSDSTPDEFIPIAEDTGLIVALGAWVLDRAVADLAAWRRQRWGAHLSVSVNVSSRQFREDDLVGLVTTTLARHRVPSSALCIELTESVVMEDTADTAATLAALRALGVALSIDDFGTGYSSLSYLHRFPVDQLKVDRAFVSQLGVAGHGASVVQAIVAMASALGISTTAEGIEDPEQLRTLRAMGCDAGQGWLFAKAVPAGALGGVVHRLQPRPRELPTWAGTAAPAR